MTHKINAAGVSLVEVLIAISIFSLGALGIAGMQTSAITNTHLAYQYSEAALLAQNIAESLRTNPPLSIKDCLQPACSSMQTDGWDVDTWDLTTAHERRASAKDYSGILPSGKIDIRHQTYDNHSIQLITVYWDARRNGATGTGCDPAIASDLNCFRLALAL